MTVQIFAWVMDIFFIFTLHILYKKILEVRFENRVALLLGWSGCFLAWNVCGYLGADIPIVNGICSIVINFLVLHLLYTGRIRTKMILVFVVIVLGFIAEVMIVFLMECLGMSVAVSEQSGEAYFFMGNALSKILWFVFVKIIAKLSEKEKPVNAEFTEWVETLCVPFGSILIFYLLARDAYFEITIERVIIFAIIMTINIVTYYLYQRVKSHAAALYNNKLLQYQNEYYKARFEDTEKQWNVLRKIRHDMRNNYVLYMNYLENEQYAQLYELYENEIGKIKGAGALIHTGVIGIDAIVNYKIEVAKEAGIEVHSDVKVGQEPAIRNEDLNILLGNLFDNAIEAVSKLGSAKREIWFKLHTDATALLFEIKNPYDGQLQENEKGELLTVKQNRRSHGIGLRVVKEIVKRYHGSVEISHSEAFFEVSLLIYGT